MKLYERIESKMSEMSDLNYLLRDDKCSNKVRRILVDKSRSLLVVMEELKTIIDPYTFDDKIHKLIHQSVLNGLQ